MKAIVAGKLSCVFMLFKMVSLEGNRCCRISISDCILITEFRSCCTSFASIRLPSISIFRLLSTSEAVSND